MVDTEPPQPPPPLPTEDQQFRAESLMLAYGSEEGRAKLAAWRERVNAIRRTDRLIELRMTWAEQHPARRAMGNIETTTDQTEARDYLTPWGELEDTLRPAERAARTELATQLASELRTTNPT